MLCWVCGPWRRPRGDREGGGGAALVAGAVPGRMGGGVGAGLANQAFLSGSAPAIGGVLAVATKWRPAAPPGRDARSAGGRVRGGKCVRHRCGPGPGQPAFLAHLARRRLFGSVLAALAVAV